MKDYQHVATQAEQPQQWQRAGAIGSPNMHSHVLVPLAWSVVGGALVGTLIAAGAWAVLPDGGLLPLKAGAVAGALAAVVLFFRDSSWTRSTIWQLERATGQDLDRDGHVGKVEGHGVLVLPRQGQEAARKDAEVRYRQQMAHFVRGCVKRTDGPYWEPRIGRDFYVEFRDVLIGAGYAVWKNDRDHRAGWLLTKKPEQILTEMFAPPTPTLNNTKTGPSTERT